MKNNLQLAPNPGQSVEKPKPNFALRRVLGTIGVTAALAASGTIGDKILGHIHNNKVDAEVSQPTADVMADLETGKIDSADVTIVKAPETGLAWNIAEDLTKGDPRLLSHVIASQTGEQVDKRELLVIPNHTLEK